MYLKFFCDNIARYWVFGKWSEICCVVSDEPCLKYLKWHVHCYRTCTRWQHIEMWIDIKGAETHTQSADVFTKEDK